LVREFLEPVVYLLERSRAFQSLGSTGSAVSAADLGVLGAAVQLQRSQHARWESLAERLQSDIDDLKDWIVDRDRVIGDLKDWIDQLQVAKEYHEKQHVLLRRRVDDLP